MLTNFFVFPTSICLLIFFLAIFWSNLIDFSSLHNPQHNALDVCLPQKTKRTFYKLSSFCSSFELFVLIYNFVYFHFILVFQTIWKFPFYRYNFSCCCCFLFGTHTGVDKYNSIVFYVGCVQIDVEETKWKKNPDKKGVIITESYLYHILLQPCVHLNYAYEKNIK